MLDRLLYDTPAYHWPDEEPDWDENEAARAEFDDSQCNEFCERCGHQGHDIDNCPIELGGEG